MIENHHDHEKEILAFFFFFFCESACVWRLVGSVD